MKDIFKARQGADAVSLEARKDGISRTSRERGGSRAREVYKALKSMILSGEIPANEQIDEQGMSLRFGVSRTPVREALLRLQSDGLVEMMRGRGIRVAALTLEEIRQIYEATTGIETMAVLAIARRRPNEDAVASLDEGVVRMELAAEAEDAEAWGQADEQFHRLILEMAANPFITAAGLQLRDRAQRVHLVAVRLQSAEYRKASTDHHRALVDAIATKHPLAVAKMHLRQRLRGERELISIFRLFSIRAL